MRRPRTTTREGGGAGGGGRGQDADDVSVFSDAGLDPPDAGQDSKVRQLSPTEQATTPTLSAIQKRWSMSRSAGRAVQQGLKDVAAPAPLVVATANRTCVCVCVCFSLRRVTIMCFLYATRPRILSLHGQPAAPAGSGRTEFRRHAPTTSAEAGSRWTTTAKEQQQQQPTFTTITSRDRSQVSFPPHLLWGKTHLP